MSRRDSMRRGNASAVGIRGGALDGQARTSSRFRLAVVLVLCLIASLIATSTPAKADPPPLPPIVPPPSAPGRRDEVHGPPLFLERHHRVVGLQAAGDDASVRHPRTASCLHGVLRQHGELLRGVRGGSGSCLETSIEESSQVTRNDGHLVASTQGIIVDGLYHYQFLMGAAEIPYESIESRYIETLPLPGEVC